MEVFVGLAGTTVAFLGVRSKKFGTDEKGAYYVPDIYLGLAVSALLTGRTTNRAAPEVNEAERSDRD